LTVRLAVPVLAIFMLHVLPWSGNNNWARPGLRRLNRRRRGASCE